MTKKWRKFRSLPPPERWLLLHCGGLLIFVHLALILLPLTTVVGLLGSRKRRSPSQGIPAERVCYLVEVAARHVPVNTTCLRKALVLYHLLAGRMAQLKVSVGTRMVDERFEAHAWLESEGQVIFGGPVNSYAPLVSFGGAPTRLG